MWLIQEVDDFLKFFVTFSWQYTWYVILSSQKFPKWCQIFLHVNCYNLWYLHSSVSTISSVIVALHYFSPSLLWHLFLTNLHLSSHATISSVFSSAPSLSHTNALNFSCFLTDFRYPQAIIRSTVMHQHLVTDSLTILD